MKNILKSISLYLYQYLDKKFIIVFFIIMVLNCFVFYFNSSYPFSNIFYILNRESIIESYFSESLFYYGIANIIIVTVFLSSNAQSDLTQFDDLMRSKHKFGIIFIIKNTAIITIFFIYAAILYLIMIAFALLIYDDFILSFYYVETFFKYFIVMLFYYLLGTIILSVIRNQFASIIIFLFYYFLQVVSEDIYKIIGKIFPIISYNSNYISILSCSYIYLFNAILIFTLLSFFMLIKKNQKYS